MIYEVSEELANAIAKAGMSPPICFGRLHTEWWGKDKFFIGLCSQELMEKLMREMGWEEYKKHERILIHPAD